MRSAVAFVVLLLACGADASAPPTSIAPSVDRSEAERPLGIALEISLDGGDAALAALVGQLPPSSARAALPTRVSVLLDGLIETPTEIRSRVAAGSPVRLLMARVDGELRSAVAVRLDEPVPASEQTPGGPRGSSRVGSSAAVDDRIAVVSDDPAMLELAFAYLAYTALARPGQAGAIVAYVPATTLATTVRTALAQGVEEQRAQMLASIARARAVHDRPPDFGDPEALVTLVSDALLARLAYLPDLGDATVTLAPTPSGLALTMTADVTAGSPLALALAGRSAVPSSFVAAAPTGSAIVIATGATPAMREATSGELVDFLSAIGGDRVSASERSALEGASRAIAEIRGDRGVLALGANEATGLFLLTATQGGTEIAAPVLWGRGLPWTSGLLGALFGCTVTSARTATLCGDVVVSSRITGDVRTDALGRGAVALADSMTEALAQEVPAASPDLARDLAASPSATFAWLVLRPLRVMPVLAMLGSPPRAGLPRGDGALVLALAQDHARLSISLRASTAAMADLDVVVGWFADETDSE